ncbi:cell wall anchor protein [Limosilactobacillus fermentum]
MGVDGYSIGAMNGATLSTQITFVIGEDGTTGKVVEIVPAQTPTANEKDYTWEYVYSPKAQSFTVTYVDDTTGEELTDHDFTLSGVTDRSYAKTLASDKWDYAAAGYVLDTDQNATDPLDSLSGTFGATNVNVVVCLKHGTTTQEETGTSTYTVNCTGAANNPTSQPQTIDYTRTNTVDTMTGLVTAYGDWSVTGDRTSFTSIMTPVVTGYVADKASSTVDNATPSEGTAESDTVTYSPVGTVTITKPGGIATTAAYTNDQSDTTKVTSFSVPAVAGYSAQVTGATLQSDGTYLPDSPTQASTVTYTADPQSFTVTYVDETTNTTLTDHGLTLTGVTAGSYADQLASDKWDYAAAGYKLDTAKNATDPLSELSGTFGAQNAGVTVYLTHQTSTTTQTQTITRTINYLDPTTKELTSLTQTAELTRTVEEDLVTGAKTYSQWTTDT